MTEGTFLAGGTASGGGGRERAGHSDNYEWCEVGAGTWVKQGR